jgi:hypothetical protein
MKKFIFPIITLILGLLIGYFIPKNGAGVNKKIAVADSLASTPFKFIPGTSDTARNPLSQVFPRAKAIQNITDFQTLNQAAGTSGIQGTSGAFNGFYIDAPSLNAILADKSLTGISFYLGKHPDHPGTTDKILSVYFTGAKTNPNAPPQFDNPTTSDVYEYVLPCPPACGNLVPSK